MAFLVEAILILQMATPECDICCNTGAIHTHSESADPEDWRFDVMIVFHDVGLYRKDTKY